MWRGRGVNAGANAALWIQIYCGVLDVCSVCAVLTRIRSAADHTERESQNLNTLPVIAFTMTAIRVLMVAALAAAALAAAFPNHPLGECRLLIGQTLVYPVPNGGAFAVDYNATTMQANYASYVLGGFRYYGARARVSDDPYGICPMTYGDYRGSGYQRGHLVPFADAGNVTQVMTNMVPMSAEFNNGSWLNYEKVIRENCVGMRIVKGCEYDFDKYYVTLYGRQLYLPIGCYFVIFNGTTVIDYGYLTNATQSEPELRLPFWVDCAHGGGGGGLSTGAAVILYTSVAILSSIALILLAAIVVMAVHAAYTKCRHVSACAKSRMRTRRKYFVI